MKIWTKIVEMLGYDRGGPLPEIKEFPPMPPVEDPCVIGEPASLIIKALQDDSLEWEYYEESDGHAYTEGVRSAVKSYEIGVRHNGYSERPICPGVSSFVSHEKWAVIAEVRSAISRIAAKGVEEERLAAIELFKEYREE